MVINSPKNDLWYRFSQDKLALMGLGIFGLIILAILLGPLLYQTPMDKIDFSQSTIGPSLSHPLGTNDLGQDQLARLLFGGRISLTVGLAAMGVAMSVGTLVGAIAGFYGGRVDTFLMGVTNLFLSLPQLPLLLLIVYLFRDSLKTLVGPEWGIFILVVLVIGLLNWMSVARLVRGQFLKLREMEFISAARALGASPWRLIWVHLLPNVFGVMIVAATLAVANGIITESTLSFLGLGFPPDLPTWGQMLFKAKDYLTTAPFMALFPALAIFLTVMSINYIGDGLQDALNPKVKK
jgi:peptide/nickel transport system permease protein